MARLSARCHPLELLGLLLVLLDVSGAWLDHDVLQDRALLLHSCGEAVPRDVREIYDRGLAFLASSQNANGDWPGQGYNGPGVTGMAVMTFLASGEDPKHHLADESDVLLPLADVIPVGSPFNIVVSAGDVVSYVGATVPFAGGS